MPRVAKGHVEQLPSGSWRARVYAGVDPITQREIRLKATATTEQQAYIELGRLLKQASEGRTPESGATMAKLLDEYAAIAPWDVSTRQTNEGFIRRTIKPALGHLQVRKVRGPILDKLYAELRRCGDLSCTGRPFTEHRNIPALVINPRDPRPAWQQVTETLAEAIRSGILAPGDELPSITELVALQGIGTGVMRHALEALAADGLILVRRGQTAVVAGNPGHAPPGARRRPGPAHDCRSAGCRPHVCHPMKASTIRGIHSILSGAFAAAQRWEWTDRNPAESAKPPTTIRRPIPATSPDDVAKVIAEARAHTPALGLYLWLVVVTGVRRGELCGLQIRDTDLDRGLVHVAFNYVVRGGQRVRKDTKTHQDRWLAIDPDTCALTASYLDEIRAELAAVGVELSDDAYLFSNDPAHSRPWNPDWATHKVAQAAAAAGVKLDIKGGRHYTASQLLAGGFDLRNTAARLGHSGGGATTLRHYADPVPEVDRRAAAYLAQLTARSTPSSPQP
jgi:integrase/DNA-binding transcriptional regulator YhcF (GntR family)